MNEANIQKLIDHLKKVPEDVFDLDIWLHRDNLPLVDILFDAKKIVSMQENSGGEHACGTIGCIAGHAVLLAAAEDAQLKWTDMEVYARTWLGLTLNEANKLFTPNSGDVNYSLVDTEAAISVLKLLKEKHYVSWEEAAPEVCVT